MPKFNKIGKYMTELLTIQQFLGTFFQGAIA